MLVCSLQCGSSKAETTFKRDYNPVREKLEHKAWIFFRDVTCEPQIEGKYVKGCCLACFVPQGETKVLKLKNLRPKDFADYTCQVSVRNVCNIEDKSVTFRLTNATGMLVYWFALSGDGVCNLWDILQLNYSFWFLCLSSEVPYFILSCHNLCLPVYLSSFFSSALSPFCSKAVSLSVSVSIF